MSDAKMSLMIYTMLNDSEERKLVTFEGQVVGFVINVLGSTQRSMWTGGTAGEGRMIRLVVPGQMPPVILELRPCDIPGLTPTSLMAMLNKRISHQIK